MNNVVHDPVKIARSLKIGAAILVLCAWLAPTCQAASSYAVVIGISNYQLSQHWPSLPNGRSDAEHMAAALAKQGFSIKSFLDADATREKIDAYMEDQLAPKLAAEDRVLFFFAGHGTTRTFGDVDVGYIVPFNGTTGPSTWISMEQIRELSRLMNKAHHQLFILDSCFGGALATRGTFLPADIPDYIEQLQKRIARTVITAGGKDQKVADSGFQGTSVFVHELIRALELGDAQKTGYVTAHEMFDFLVHSASTSDQTPAFGTLPGDESGEMVFTSPYFSADHRKQALSHASASPSRTRSENTSADPTHQQIPASPASQATGGNASAHDTQEHLGCFLTNMKVRYVDSLAECRKLGGTLYK